MGRTRTLQAIAIVVGLLAITGLAAEATWDGERERAHTSNLAEARQVATTVRQGVVLFAGALRGGEGIAGGDVRPPESRFRVFARDVVGRTPFFALSFAPRVTGPQRGRFERRVGVPVSKLAPESGLMPAKRANEYYPIEFTYPAGPTEAALRGLDLRSEAGRAAASRAAERRGIVRASRPVATVRTRRPGVNLLDPLFARGDSARAGDDAAGYLVGAVEGRAILRAARRQLDTGVAIRVSDAGARIAGGRRVGSDGIRLTVPVLGRRWSVAVGPSVSANPTAAIAIGAIGLIISVLAATLFALALRRERQRVVQRREIEVRAARDSLLSRVSDQLEREVGAEARLAALAPTLVPALGDICMVDVLTENGRVRRAGAASADPQTLTLIGELAPPQPTSPIYAAIESRQPVLSTAVADRPKHQREPAEPEDPDLRLQARLRSSMVIPLIARGTVYGTLLVGVLRASGRPALGTDDLVFATEVASHAALAFENARLYEEQRHIAGILQRALLPPTLPVVEGAEVAARHRPGRQGTEMGGDFYDLFEVDGNWIAALGDVCGKGPEAAALTGLVRHTLRATAEAGPAPAVQRVHEAIRSSGQDTFCTLVCAELSGGASNGDLTARVTTAGHPQPRVIAPSGAVRKLDVTGPLVGAFDGASFADQTLTLHSGELLFVCSDGVPEARHGGELFGEERLDELLSGLAGRTPEELIDAVEATILGFVDDDPQDDIALLAIRVGRSHG